MSLPTEGDNDSGRAMAEEVRRLLAAENTTVQEVLVEELFNAIRENDYGTVRLLLTEFRRVEAPWESLRERKTGDTPLHAAIKQDYFQMIGLMRNYCHPDENVENCGICTRMLEMVNKEGNTALHEAVLKRSSGVVDYLLRHGAVVDSATPTGVTPLMMAANSIGLEGFKMAVILLDKGADPTRTDDQGRTALHFASRLGWIDTVNVLLGRSKDIANIIDCLGRTALHLASLHGKKLVVELLMNASSRLDISDQCGMTPLHYAIRGGDIQVIQILKSFGASLHEHDKNNFTCMHFAATIGRPQVVEFLIMALNKNVDIQTPSELLTPLHCAVKAGHIKCVQVLLAHGAKIGLKDAKGRTPLEMAPFFYEEEIEQLFDDAEKFDSL